MSTEAEKRRQDKNDGKVKLGLGRREDEGEEKEERQSNDWPLLLLCAHGNEKKELHIHTEEKRHAHTHTLRLRNSLKQHHQMTDAAEGSTISSPSKPSIDFVFHESIRSTKKLINISTVNPKRTENDHWMACI